MPNPEMVLSVVWYKIMPAEFGGQKGITIFSRYLAGHIGLTMLCSSNNRPTGKEPFTVWPMLPASKTQFLLPGTLRKISLAIERAGANYLLLEHCYHGPAGIWLQKRKKVKLIVHSHNIEYQRFRQLGKWWWRILYQLERYTHRQANLNLFKTPEDLEVAIRQFRLDPAKCMVVPYGLEGMQVSTTLEKKDAGMTIRARHGIRADQKILLFNGTLDYAPNAEAMKEIVEKLMPLLGSQYVVVVCGRLKDPSFKYLENLKAPGFIYAGFVDDIGIYFKGADVFINPVASGGGVKVKVMEALSYGLPVISYASGATGIDTQLTGSMLRLVPDHDAAAMTRALEGIKAGDTVPETFIRHYHWERITGEVAGRIRQLDRE